MTKLYALHDLKDFGLTVLGGTLAEFLETHDFKNTPKIFDNTGEEGDLSDWGIKNSKWRGDIKMDADFNLYLPEYHILNFTGLSYSDESTGHNTVDESDFDIDAQYNTRYPDLKLEEYRDELLKIGKKMTFANI